MNEKQDRLEAETLLGTAASIVGTERGQQHGELMGSFEMIAMLWTTWLVNTNKVRYGNDIALFIKPSDVLEMMSLMKKARKVWGDGNKDNPIDDLGYTALAAVAQHNEGPTAIAVEDPMGDYVLKTLIDRDKPTTSIHPDDMPMPSVVTKGQKGNPDAK